MSGLEGQVAIVTGAGSGIGRAAAVLYAAEGGAVVAADGSGAEEETAAALGDSVTSFNVDMTDPDSVAALTARALELHGKVDALINCVGVCDVFDRIVDLTLEEFDRVLAVNLRSAFLGIRSVVPSMLEAGGGSIVNFASVGAFAATEGIAAYGASKAGVVMLTKTAALEYGLGGVRVNAVCPGPTRTAMFAGVPPSSVEAISASTALGRVGEPAEVAEAAVFLASPRASLITGVALPVDAGRLISADSRPLPAAG